MNPMFMFCMIEIVAGLALIALAPGIAHAQATIPYGSRVGMNATVVKVEGVNTRNATAFIRITEANIREFCVKYLNDRSKACISKQLKDAGFRSTINADCKTGAFINVHGQAMQFQGSAPIYETKTGKTMDYDSVPELIITDSAGEVLDGSAMSGYIETKVQFELLCPVAVQKALDSY